jgi:hypothetical protein
VEELLQVFGVRRLVNAVDAIWSKHRQQCMMCRSVHIST